MPESRTAFDTPVISVRENEISVLSPLLRETARILLIGDHHAGVTDEREKPYEGYSARMAQYSPPDMAELEKMLRRGAEEKFDLILLLGDILSFPSEAGAERLAELIRNSPVPVLFTAGNHDWHYEGLPGSDRVLRQEWTAKRLMPLYRGRDPLCYAYSLRGMEVVMMDNSVYEILPGQLDFMRAILTKGKPVLLGCHIPLYLPGAKRDAANYGCGHPGWGGASDPCWQIERRERWHEEGPCPETFAFHREVFEAPNLLGIASGHTHVFRADTFRDKFQLTVSMHRPCALELGPLPTE